MNISEILGRDAAFLSVFSNLATIDAYGFSALASQLAAITEKSGRSGSLNAPHGTGFAVHRVNCRSLMQAAGGQGVDGCEGFIYTNSPLAMALSALAGLLNSALPGDSLSLPAVPTASAPSMTMAERNLILRFPLTENFKGGVEKILAPLGGLLDTVIDYEDSHLVLRFPRLLMKYGPGIDNLSTPGFFCTGRDIGVYCEKGLVCDLVTTFLTANRWCPVDGTPPGDGDLYFIIADPLEENRESLAGIKGRFGERARVAVVLRQTGVGIGAPVFLLSNDYISPPHNLQGPDSDLLPMAEKIASCFGLSEGEVIEAGFPQGLNLPASSPVNGSGNLVFKMRRYGESPRYDGPGPSLRLLFARLDCPADWAGAAAMQREISAGPSISNVFVPLVEGTGAKRESEPSGRGSEDLPADYDFSPFIREMALGMKYLACRNCPISFDKCHHRW